MNLPLRVCLGQGVRRARADGRALVALETAVVTHGLGKEVTPFLLAVVAGYSGGRTGRANVALLHHNARLAAGDRRPPV